jgi:hypothetical protein
MEIKKYNVLQGKPCSKRRHGLLVSKKRVWTKAACVVKEGAAILLDRQGLLLCLDRLQRISYEAYGVITIAHLLPFIKTIQRVLI